MKLSCRVPLLVALALGLYPSYMDGGRVGPVAFAKAPVQDPDPQFVSYADSATGQYVVTLVRDAYVVSPTPEAPTDPGTNGVSSQNEDTVTDVGTDLATSYGATLLDSYDDMGSFVCSMDEVTARQMSHDGRVACVESNAFVYGCGTITNPGYGLDRLDQRPAVNPGGTVPNNRFSWTKDGSGVTAFVVDTGIYLPCNDFAPGQAKAGWPNASDYYTGPSDPANNFYGLPQSSNDDTYTGHGMCAADVIGGQDRGVAHAIKLVAVKVLDSNGKGTIASVVAGLQYVWKQINDKKQPNHPSGPVVLDLSLAFRNAKPNTVDSSLATAIHNLIVAKAVVVVAADNNASDAAYSSPANIPEVITVGGTDSGDNLTWYNINGNPGSNSGSLVDVYAPSLNVDLFYIKRVGNSITTPRGNGTGMSFAAPYVSGVVAQYLQGNPSATPAAVQTWITQNATTPANSSTGALHVPSWAAPGTLNRILFTNL